ncbi:hypothetical protein BDP27DRAFT_1362589 [Rhodocollybia butyracea]|uniref:Uncharacterized protein n=1 Tax=Rhodocollybia butyracea TaxID=206335 RepID=A0A9P5PQV5_9AGAR|nr:hypothetical protein BDP27DRAFT_1362589 [Rhodocollybia butyracea]
MPRLMVVLLLLGADQMERRIISNSSQHFCSHFAPTRDVTRTLLRLDTACGFGCFLTASRVWLQWTHFGRVSIDDLSVGDIFGSLRQYRGSLIYRYFLQWPVSTDNQRYVVHAGWWFARLTSHVEDDSAGFGEHARPSEDELT